jgi:hypothetical protein
MRLIDAGQLREARQRLENSVEQPADLLELVRLKLSVAERELPAASALESVMCFLLADPDHPAALQLYREFSMLQYQAGQSCVSHSHPPPASRG